MSIGDSPRASRTRSTLLARSTSHDAATDEADEPAGRLSLFLKRRRGQSVGRSLDQGSGTGLEEKAPELTTSVGHRRRESSNAALPTAPPLAHLHSPEPTISPSRPAKGSRFTIRRQPSRAFDDAASDMTARNGHVSPPNTLAARPSTAAARFTESIAGSSPPSETILPRRISGWFTQVLNTSPPPPVPPLPAASPSGSPSKTRPVSPPEGRQGPRALAGLDRMLDKARLYFMDTDSNVDRCPDDIWLIGGIVHRGWRPPGEEDILGPTAPVSSKSRKKARKQANRQAEGTAREKRKLRTPFTKKRTAQVDPRDALSIDTTSLASSSNTSLQRSVSPPESTVSSTASPPSPSRLSAGSSHETASTLSQTPPTLVQTQGWPPRFYHDFASRIQLTYRAGFPAIPCSQPTGMANAFQSVIGSLGASMGRNNGGVDGLSTDSGWGCMLRTGQSLLANALANIHLGRDWRRSLPLAEVPSQGVSPPPSFATYVRLLTWFFDDPSPLCPFSVHRFALMGKQLGKQVGEWFGPSTAQGAIKALANGFAPAGLGVATAIDGTLYRTDVFAAATLPGEQPSTWSRPVLILLNLRLGIEGVNPIYYESIKALFALPQSVGIAGGRPSSSYYFVGSQGNSLVYIDPHHTAPAVPLRSPPPELRDAALVQPMRGVVADEWETIELPTPGEDDEALERCFGSLYTEAELRSFHCDRVRKMALSGLDPSMLVGLLCQTEAEWVDLCERLKQMAKTSTPLVHVADRPPAWARSTSASQVPGSSRKTSASSRPTALSEATTSPAVSDDGDEAEASFDEPDDWDITTDEDLAGESDDEAPVASSGREAGAPTPILAPPRGEDDWLGVESPTTPR